MTPTNDRKWTDASALLAAALVVLLQLELLTGRAGPVGDASALVMPSQMLVGDFARAGELLLWNPWTNGGAPDGVEPQFGALSPLVIACAWIGGGTALSATLVLALAWALGAAGFARLARHLGAPAWAQFAVAVAFATNGVFLGHASHPNVLHGAAFLPWAVLAFDRALVLERRPAGRALDAALGGAALGLGGLAGYPGVTVVHGLFLAAWAAWRCAGGARPAEAVAASARVAGVPLARAALSLALLAVVCGVVLLPNHLGFLWEARGYTARESTLTREVATGWEAVDRRHANALEPRALWTALHPGIAPRAWPPGQQVLEYTDATSAGLHTGLGTVVLALLALVGAQRWRWRGLLALGLLFLLLAMGSVLPLRAWLYDLVPPTRFFRHAALFRGPWLFALAVLAVEGARRVAVDARAAGAFARVGLVVAPLAAALSALAHVALDLPLEREDVLWWIVAHGGLVLVALAARERRPRWTVALALWMALEALANHRVSLQLVQEGPEAVERLQRTHVASIELGAAGFERRLLPAATDARVQQAFVDGDHAWLIEQQLAGAIRPIEATNLVAKQAVLLGRSAMDHSIHAQLPLHEALREQALGGARVFFARDGMNAGDGQLWFAEYARVALESAPALVLHDRPIEEFAGDALAAKLAACTLHLQGVRIERYRPTELVLALDPPPAEDGWLYVTERFSPGWRASVDGLATPVVRAGFVWRALEVRAGSERVAFEYRPRGHPWLWLASWGTLALVLGTGAVTALRRCRRRQS